MKLSGKVVFQDLEMGVWTIEGDDGQVYQLAGHDRALERAGKRVEVEGDVKEDGVSFSMAGPMLSVKRFRFL